MTKNTTAAQDDTTDCTVVTATAQKLTTTCGQGKQHDYTLAKDAKVTCDGQPAKSADLKAGTPVRLTTKKDDATVVTAVMSGKDIKAPVQKA